MANGPLNRRTKLARSESELIARLSRAEQCVYSPQQLIVFFRAMRANGLYGKQTAYKDFLGFVLRRGHLTQVLLSSPHYDDTQVRFCRGHATPLDLAASVRPTGYFSHSTAAYLNGLIERCPATLFRNLEQTAKPKSRPGDLSQANLDRAFAARQRESKLCYTFNGVTLTMLSGKRTGRLGVASIAAPDGRAYAATNLVRTLIDLTVRPAYAGGSGAVLACYRAARARVGVSELLSMLDDLDYVYPFAQAVGFLAQRSGFPAADLQAIEQRVTPLKFYLSHAIENPVFDDRWNIHYPKGL